MKITNSNQKCSECMQEGHRAVRCTMCEHMRCPQGRATHTCYVRAISLFQPTSISLHLVGQTMSMSVGGTGFCPECGLTGHDATICTDCGAAYCPKQTHNCPNRPQLTSGLIVATRYYKRGYPIRRGPGLPLGDG